MALFVSLLIALVLPASAQDTNGCYSMTTHTCDCDVSQAACTGTWTDGCTSCGLLTFYLPATNISTASELDISQAALESALGESPINYAGALSAYTSTANGGTSLQALSTGAESAMGGQTLYDMYEHYFNHDADYVSARVTGALSTPVTAGSICATVCGTAGTPCDQCRKEISKKSSNYMGVWMWIIGKMETAVAACSSGTPLPDWDEALAYYSGSLEGRDGSGSGKFIYHLADKRAENYETRFSNGTSNVNVEIIQQFRNGKDALTDADCTAAQAALDRIVTLMSIPLVQGALRYAYKVGVLSGGSKERAEGDVFSAAILPRIDNCDTSAATTISNNQGYNAASPMGDGFAAVKEAYESVYTCLGITCADIGCLIETGTTCYADFSTCTDPDPTSSAAFRGMQSAWVAMSVTALLVLFVGTQV